MIHKEVVIGDARLLLGDCMEVLPTLGKVDAVITDPPYGIALDTDYSSLARSTRTYAPIAGDDLAFNPAPLLSLAPCAFFGADHFHDTLPSGGTWHIWDKRGAAKSNMFADFETWWTSWKSGPSRILRYQWICGVHPGVTPERVEHPTVKPVPVMQGVIANTDYRLILDPFMGSGSTGIACVQLGRKFVGIEREPKYFDVACQRIEQAYNQRPLFEPEPQKKPEQLGLGAA